MQPAFQVDLPPSGAKRSSRIAQWVRALVGPHLGVIEEIRRVACEPDDVPLNVFAGRICRTAGLQDVDAPRTASGAAMARDDALAACIGEAAERYAAALVPPAALVRASATELSGDVAPPDEFSLFTAGQRWFVRRRVPFRKWTRSDRIGWREARCLASGHAVWVPAVFVQQPYRIDRDEPLLAPTLSTGLAAGSSSRHAALRGMCEVVERDAVALAWLGGIAPPRIELLGPDQPSETAEIVRFLDARGFRWGLFDLSTDCGIPVAAALMEGNSSLGPVVSFGSACHHLRVHAARKALVEAAHCRMYVKSLLREQPAQVRAADGEPASFAAHACWHTVHPERRHGLERWWSSPLVRRWECGPRESESDEVALARLVDRLAALGHRALCVDLTPPDLESVGLHVVRAIVPGLQPLHGNHAWPHLGGRRLRRLAPVFGSHVRQPRRWNPDPHPCP